jgi:predicted transcriptional regulator
MKIKSIMAKPVFIKPDATKKELVKIIRKNKNTQVFIVVDDNKRFLGDIHENDLFYMILPNDRYEDIGMELAFDLEKKFFATTAKEIMRKHDLSCGPEDEMMDVALDFAASEINEMPVIDKSGKVVGVITQGMLLRHMK